MLALGAVVFLAMVAIAIAVPGGSFGLPLAFVALIIIVLAVAGSRSSHDLDRIQHTLHNLAGFSASYSTVSEADPSLGDQIE